jgi:serine/threonine-protein kinase
VDDREQTATSAEKGGFGAFWSTLGLDGVALATSETVRPETLTKAKSKTAGLSPRTLPLISISLPTEGAEARLPTEQVGDIKVTGQLGEGGMGKVLLAEQRSLRREVALKTLKDPAASPVYVDALLREGIVTGHLEHPNITPVHQLGVDAGGRPVLVMKRISGVAWAKLLRDPAHEAWDKLPALPDDRQRAHLEVLMQVANALALAHSRGVIHRDVKPDNVMIGEFGEVYLVDWGIALELAGDAAGGPRRLVGTPQFLAPEMIDGSLPLGAWTDIYLLGATLHVILTGKPPHDGDDLHDTLAAAWESVPYAYGPDVPAELAELCHRAMARDPELRLRSAAAFRTALQDYLLHKSSLALARTANESLDRLIELRSRPDHDRGEVLRAAAECRFGHLMALREWRQNPVAETGLQRALVQLVELEIRAENVAGAEAWLADLKAPPPELVAAVGALAARLAERAGAEARLAQIEFDRDLSQGSGARRRLAIVMGGTGFLICMVALLMRLVPGSLTAKTSVYFGAGLLGMTLLAAYFGRKSLLSTKVNRSLMATFTFGVALMLIHRILATLRGDSIPFILQTDLLLIGGVTATAAFHITRIWLWGTAVALAGAMAIHLVPMWAAGVFLVASMIVLGLLGFRWQWRGEP